MLLTKVNILKLEKLGLLRRLCSAAASNIDSGFEVSSGPEVNQVNFRSANSQLFVWGLAEHGALGLDKNSRSNHGRFHSYKHKPTRHFFSDCNMISDITCGYGFSAIAVHSRDTHKVYGTGINTDSQIGYHDPRKGHPLETLVSPAPIELGIKNINTRVLSLSAGRAHLAVVTDDEGVFSLGSNCYGQCGRPIIEDEKYCTSGYVHNLTDFDGEKAISVVCGQDHTLFLTGSGKVYSCGWGGDGQTGLDHNDNVSTPTRVRGDIEDQVIVKLACQSDTVLALSKSGQVFGWGNTEYGQLTTPDQDLQFIKLPIELNKLNIIGKIIDIAAGGSVCLALSYTGSVYVWGYGILGLGPNVDQSAKPLRIPPPLFGANEFQPNTYVTKIYAGWSHMAAVNNYGQLYTWGRNAHGCLGIGHIRDQFFPYRVSISNPVGKVSCGVDHTMVICP